MDSRDDARFSKLGAKPLKPDRPQAPPIPTKPAQHWRQAAARFVDATGIEAVVLGTDSEDNLRKPMPGTSRRPTRRRARSPVRERPPSGETGAVLGFGSGGVEPNRSVIAGGAITEGFWC